MAKPNLLIQDNFIHRRIQIIPEDHTSKHLNKINNSTMTRALYNYNNIIQTILHTLQNHQPQIKLIQELIMYNTILKGGILSLLMLQERFKI